MAKEIIERRIHYSYGVNSGWVHQAWPEFETSYDALQERIERESMGPVNVDKRESRVVIYGDWEEDVNG